MRKFVLIAGTINHHADTEEARYVHLDGSPRDIYDAELELPVQPDVVAALHDELPMFRNDMFDEVVCDHVLEHLDGHQVVHALHAIYRVLKPGGMFVAETPNMSAIAQAWVNRDYPEAELQQWIHGENLGGEFDGHRYSYSPESLKAALHEAKFVVVEQIEKGLAVRIYAKKRGA